METNNKLTIFSSKDFSLLWFGQLFSTIGNWVYSMFLLIYISKLTDRAIIVSGILMTTMLPNIFLGPIIGNYIDKKNKKYIIVLSDLIRGLIILGMLPVMTFYNGNQTLLVVFIFIFSMLSNIAGCFFDPSVRAMLPRIEKKDIKKANSYFSMIGSISLVLGPAFGGTIVSILGFEGVVIFNACTFIVSAISEMFITYTEESSKVKKEKLSFINKYKSGWDALSKFEDIKYYVVIAGVRSLVVGLINISFVFVAAKVFVKGSESVGFIYSALGSGLILGSLLIAYWKYKLSDLKLYLYVILINALLSIVYIFTPSYVIALSAMFIVGISDGFQSVLLYSNIHKIIGIYDAGKVCACASSIMMGFQLFSMVVGGILFDYFNSSFVVLAVAIITIIWTCTYYNRINKK